MAAGRPSPQLSRALVLVFAVSTGLCAANLYYAQPVLGTVAKAFHTDSGTAGLVVTLAQIGYAAGLAFLVPLGDLISRRRLVPAVLALTTAGLVISAAAPDIGVLIAVGLLVGLGSVVAQILVPMAASLAEEEHRGQVVGTVMSGLLLGILLARTASGIVAGVSSWRVVYVAAAVLALAQAVVLARVLPAEQPRVSVSYGRLLASTLRFGLTQRTLQWRGLFGALGFAAFSVFWTTMAFLLSGPPFHYSDLTIGLFGLVGAGGALCANLAGRFADRGMQRPMTLIFAVCVTASFPLLWVGRHQLATFIVAIVVLDVGVQGIQVTNQSIIYQLAPDARSRVNSAYMVMYFAGGAVGSALGSSLYGSHRWAGVCVLGAAIGAVATVMGAADLVRMGVSSPLAPSLPAAAGREAGDG